MTVDLNHSALFATALPQTIPKFEYVVYFFVLLTFESCTRLFEETLRSPNVSFYGNVKIGEPPLTLSTLVDMHDAVVLCTGMSAPRKLGIPGEDVLNAYTSAQIVGWYNGDPEHSAIQPHLANARRIAIIGHGNVALDVARVFLKPWREFENTTISPNALNTLSQSTVEHVDIIGRRGPLQVCLFFVL